MCKLEYLLVSWQLFEDLGAHVRSRVSIQAESCTQAVANPGTFKGNYRWGV